MTPEEFTSEMLGELRREFYRGATEKQFFQEAQLLREAIFFPTRYLNVSIAVRRIARYFEGGAFGPRSKKGRSN